MTLQSDAVAWHTDRFPAASAIHVTLKLCEETGEVASAINAGCEWNTGGEPRGDVVGELADVVICCLIIAGRYYDSDISATVATKLAVLNNPASGHRSALQAPM